VLSWGMGDESNALEVKIKQHRQRVTTYRATLRRREAELADAEDTQALFRSVDKAVSALSSKWIVSADALREAQARTATIEAELTDLRRDIAERRAKLAESESELVALERQREEIAAGAYAGRCAPQL
jgi:chromosome segregation ATPase